MSREKPILFGDPMVRAILDGRKTQTRRRFTHRHAVAIGYIGPSGEEHDPSNWGYFFDGPDHHGYMVLGRGHDERQDHGRISIPCPYGETGDRLWVRETWCQESYSGRDLHTDSPIHEVVIRYRSDDRSRTIRMPEAMHDGTLTRNGRLAWRPSIHMPRWASRITLEVTDVRVQRLQDISEEDARAEGLSWWSKDGQLRKWGLAERHTSGELDSVTPWADMAHTAQEAFARLWDGINGKPPGRRERRRAAGEERERNRVLGYSNPWVWAITFVVIRS